MKNIIIITFTFSTLLQAIPIEKTIDELLVHEQKKVLKISTYDPFKRAKPLLIQKSTKAAVAKPKPLEVIAVMNNKAFINNRWYTKGDTLYQGKITKITQKSVYLKKGTKTTVLHIKKGEDLLKIRPKDHK